MSYQPVTLAATNETDNQIKVITHVVFSSTSWIYYHVSDERFTRLIWVENSKSTTVDSFTFCEHTMFFFFYDQDIPSGEGCSLGSSYDSSFTGSGLNILSRTPQRNL